MLNFKIEPAVLAPYVPAGTEIDFWNGATYISMVGFRFVHTCVLGVPACFHRNFDEVNLRFYVRRRVDDQWRRGVVFIKEIVPHRLIAWAARTLYQENYVALPMRSQIAVPGAVRYEWWADERWNHLEAIVLGEPQAIVPVSEPEFITEHYWGYSKQRDGSTIEYQVEHPPWKVWTAQSASHDIAVETLYDPRFVPYLREPPTSAFVADGSAIAVRFGRRL